MSSERGPHYEAWTFARRAKADGWPARAIDQEARRRFNGALARSELKTAVVDGIRAGKDLGELEEGSSLRARVPDLSKARPPTFAWEGRLLAGYLNLLLGEEGVGKGTLAARLIAEWTHGTLPGAFHGRPVGVGIMSDEDSFDDVWTPRLYAAGADLECVRQIDHPDGGFVHIAEDRSALKRQAKQHGLEILFFDQLLDHLGVDIDVFNQKKVRDALQPIRRLARELEVAAIGSLHPNKRGQSFRQLVFGAGFNQVARSALWLAQDPDDPDLRVVVRGKGNLAKRPPALTFRVREKFLRLNRQRWGVPVAEDFTEVDTSVDDLLASFDSQRKQPDYSKRGSAKEVITSELPKDGEWHDAGPIIEATGVDPRTARKAREALPIETRAKPGSFPATYEWRWAAGKGYARTQPAQSSQSVQRFHGAKAVRTERTGRTERKRNPAQSAQQKSARPKKGREG